MARLYGPGPGDPSPLVVTRDLAGLSTTDVEDRPVGELYGALSEADTGLIRYLDVSLTDLNKHVLVPIGHARLHTDSPRPACRLRAATYEDLLAVPEFDPERTAVDSEYQARLLQAHGLFFYGASYYAHPAFDHEHVYAGESPVVEVGSEGPNGGVEGSAAPGPSSALRPLSALAERASRSPARELVGASVDDAFGNSVGDVSDILVEIASGQPRYAVLDLEGPDRRAAIPLGFLVAAGDDDRLVTPGLTRADIQLLPPYQGPPTRAEENRMRAALEGRLDGERYFHRPDFRHPGR